MRVCTQCGFTYAEFQSRGLLGCTECYACFGDALWADLLQIHPHLYSQKTMARTRTENLEELAQLKEMLADALRGEQYEEAARLKGRIRLWEENRGLG